MSYKIVSVSDINEDGILFKRAVIDFNFEELKTAAKKESFISAEDLLEMIDPTAVETNEYKEALIVLEKSKEYNPPPPPKDFGEEPEWYPATPIKKDRVVALAECLTDSKMDFNDHFKEARNVSRSITKKDYLLLKKLIDKYDEEELNKYSSEE